MNPRSHVRLLDTGLGFERSDAVVVLRVVIRPRTAEQKQLFYRLLSERLLASAASTPAT